MTNPLTQDHEPNAPLQFGTLWRAMAVLGFAMLTASTVGLFTWGVWVTVSIYAHGTEIAILKDRSGSKGVSQNVNVGQAKAAEMAMPSAKTWLTTKDVAAREKVTERTVLNYIAAGQIEPAPVKDGKEWKISEHFRIVPNAAENCGEPALTANPEPDSDTP